MAEAQPVGQETRSCQHCYDVIYRVPGTADWWRGVARENVVCESSSIDVRHKPMPAIE